MGKSFDQVLEVVGEPEFVMVEFRKIEAAGDGQMARMASDFEEKYGHFGRTEWKALYEADGDFSAIGIPVKMDAPPIEHFDEFVAGVRRDRIQVER